MQITLESDAQFGDTYVVVSPAGKRLVRVTFKTFESSGTYVFLKLFKKNESGEFISQQRIRLTSGDLITCSKKGSSFSFSSAFGFRTTCITKKTQQARITIDTGLFRKSV